MAALRFIAFFLSCMSNCEVWWITEQHLSPRLFRKGVWRVRSLGKNGWVSWCQKNSYRSSSDWLVKAGRTSSHFLTGPLPRWGRCHQAGTGQVTLEVIGSKWSYAMKCCKPINDDNDVLICIISTCCFSISYLHLTELCLSTVAKSLSVGFFQVNSEVL